MFSKLIRGNRVFTEYSVILIVAFLLFFQILLSIYVYNKQNLENYFYATLNSVQKLLVSEENSLSNISSLVATISVEDDFMHLMHGENFDYMSFSNLHQRLRKYVSLVPGVENVYLYSNQKHMMYDIYAASYSLDHIPIELADEMVKKNYKDRRRYLLYKEQETEGYEKYNFEYIFTPDNKTGDAIIIKKKFNEVASEYIDCQKWLKSQLLVTDGEGNVVFGGVDFQAKINVMNESFFRNKIKGTQYIVGDYANKKSIFTYLYSEYCDRWYITITPYNNVLVNGFLSKQFIFIYVSIVISFIIILRCISWFKKVRKGIVEAIKVTEYNKISKKKGDDQPRKYIFDYLNNAELSSVYSIEDYLPQNFNVSKDTSVLTIRINNLEELSKQFSTVEIELYKYGIDNICNEIFGKHFSCYQVSDIDYNLQYIIGNIERNKYLDYYNEAASECMNKIEDYIGARTSYFISENKFYKDLHICYRQVNEVADYTFLYGADVILDWSVINEDNQEAFVKQKEYCEEIKQSILKNHGDECEILNTLIDNMHEMSISQMKEIFWFLLFDIHSASDILKKNGDVNVTFDTTQNLIKLERAKNVQEVSNLITEILEDISNKRQSMNANKQQLMVIKCVAIIEKEFMNKNLSLEGIADRIGFSANYLGRKFKQCTGYSLADKITDQRLTEAENLLINTEESIKEIMDKVGFSNSSYFTVTFRKRYGVTPTVYRSNKK